MILGLTGFKYPNLNPKRCQMGSILVRDHKPIQSTKEETDLIQEIWNQLEQRKKDRGY